MKKNIGIIFLGAIFTEIVLLILFKNVYFTSDQFLDSVFILKSSTMLIQIILIIYMAQKYNDIHIRTLLVLIFNLLAFLLYDILNTTSFFLLNAPDVNIKQLALNLDIIAGIFLFIIPVLFVILISYYSRNSSNSQALLPLMVFIGTYLAYGLTEEIDVIREFSTNGKIYRFFIFNPELTVFFLLTTLIFAYVGVYSFLEIWKTRKHTSNKTLKLQQTIFGIYVCGNYFIDPIILSLLFYISPNQMLVFLTYNILGPLSSIVIALIIAMPFIISNRSTYLQPQPIQWFVIFRKGGKPLFFYDFTLASPRDMEIARTVFFSGIITAVNSIMQEYANISTNIRAISFEDKVLLVRFNQDLGFILVAEYETSFLAKSLENFSHLFIKQFKSSIDEATSKSMLLRYDTDIVSTIERTFGTKL